MTETRPSVSFDHHSSEYAQNFRGVYRELHERGCRVAWTDSYGGFWVVSGYDEVARVARDDETFSSRHDLPNDGTSYTGILIPDIPQRSTPIEMDPPLFNKYRRVLNPPFAPSAIERLKPAMERFTTWCIDQVIETGEIDFVLHVANPIPAMATLLFLGLPVEEWELYAQPYHDGVAYPPNTPESNRAHELVAEGLRRVQNEIDDRRSHPRDDLLTTLTQVQIDGHSLPDSEIVEICQLILGGGLDTTTGLIAHAINYLDTHRELRPRLLADDQLMFTFCEELLRFHTPTQALARTATSDVEVGGQMINAGERVMICWAGANSDPQAFDQVDEIVVDRTPNRHAAFGLGAHRCLGSNFTRAEFSIAIRQVLERMGDYELIDGAVRYESIGIVNGWHRLPGRFTPGARRGDGSLIDS